MKTADEFARFIQCVQDLGIPHKVFFGVGQYKGKEWKMWQKLILDAGHNFTAGSILYVEIGSTQHVFHTNGSCFIMIRDKVTGEVHYQHRNQGKGPDRRIVYYTDGDQHYEDLVKVDERAL